MSVIQKIRKNVVAYGPAIFVIGATIGTGSVSSLVVSGADYGTGLLWALVPSCLFFWLLIGAMSRLTLASGQTFVSLTKTHLGKVAAFYIVLAIIVGQFSSTMGVLSIVGEAFASWTNTDFFWSTFFWSSVVFFLIAFGKYTLFERVLIILVTILGISFIVDLFFAKPSVSSIVEGLVPGIPEEGGALVVAAMVGTTLAGAVVVMRSFIVVDKGWTIEDLPHEEKDAAVSGLLVFLVSAIVMICAAATLNVRGQHVDKAIDMAFTLEPLFGSFAATLFVVGIVAAGVSSAFPNALVSIWTLSDFFDWSRDPRSPHFRIIALIYCAGGLVVPLVGGRPVFIQIAALTLQSLFMPILVLFMLIMLNKKGIVGEHTNSRFVNAAIVVALLFTTFMAYQAVVGLAETFGG